MLCSLGFRTNAATTDLTSVLPEEMAKEVKDAAQISMGTEVSEEDISNITDLCVQVISIAEYRDQLYDYLKNRSVLTGLHVDPFPLTCPY